jgi:hypothetical protein
VVQRREDDRSDEERSAGHEQGQHQTPASAVARFPWLRPLHEADAYTPENRRKGGQTCWFGWENPTLGRVLAPSPFPPAPRLGSPPPTA